MTDVLYVVRGDSEELRFSLRSLAKYASNVGRIVVAGTDLPKWLSDEVVRLEVPSPYDRKQKNILFAVLLAMRSGLLPKPALYSSDDHYLTAPMDFDAYPWFVRPYGYPSFADNAWRMSILMTGELLRKNRMPCSHRYDGHWNTHVDVADLPVVERLVSGYERTTFGYEPTSLFVAAAVVRGAAPPHPVPKGDMKLKVDSGDFAAVAASNGGMISASKFKQLPRFRKWLVGMFPEPCRWEKS